MQRMPSTSFLLSLALVALFGTGCSSPAKHEGASKQAPSVTATQAPTAQAPTAQAPAATEVEHKAITTETLEPYQCGSITRLHTLGGVFLASQPAPADFEQAKRGGVKTVINLRHDSEIKDFDEQAVVTGLGLEYVHEPWDGPDQLTDQVFDNLRTELKTAQRPILFHCGSGNRVGAVWLPHRVLDGGLSWDAALAEAKQIGLKSPDYERLAKEYIERRQKAK